MKDRVDMRDCIETIRQIGVVPVIAISDAGKAVALARALAEGGIPCAEITLRTAEGLEAIGRIAAELPEILPIAGTVLTVENAERAVAAGARCIVAPGLNPEVVQYCIDRKIPVIPGCVTPTEMGLALAMGLRVVKFFPAEQAGGLAYIRAVAAPYSDLLFMPTGGIGPENLGRYLSFPKVAACGGSWMVEKELIDVGNFKEITRRCRQAAEIVRTARGQGTNR